MLMRYDPFRELDRLAEGSRPRPAFGSLDAYRSGDRFQVDLDLPGVDPATVELTVEHNVLTVRAERSLARGEGVEILVSERAQGSFTRQLFLGEGLDPRGIEANYDRGVLRVKIPMAEQAKPRRVEISTTPDARAIDTTAA